jgi:hypothetical protein
LCGGQPIQGEKEREKTKRLQEVSFEVWTGIIYDDYGVKKYRDWKPIGSKYKLNLVSFHIII